jgi:hypothetical protein
MLIAVAALLFQFPILSLHPVQAADKITEAAATKTVETSTVSNQQRDVTDRAGVLTADAFPASSEGSVAFEPGRLVPQPVAAAASSPADPVTPSPIVATPAAAAPVYGPVYEPPIKAVSDRRQRMEWLGLSIAAHSAAGFDAWSTRRVLSSVPQAQEMNPFLRPFAGNASMYAAVQVAPTIFDYLSHRMMNSRHEFLRHTWWLPQAVSAVVSTASGVHNVGVYNSR